MRCLEVLVDLPTYVAAIRGSLNSGLTNVIPAIKWQISPVPGKIDLSTTFGAGLPTGSKAIAGPGLQPYLQFPWSWELGGGWGISGMLTNFIVPADPTNKLSTETTFVLERSSPSTLFYLSSMLAITISTADLAISSIPAAAIASPPPSRLISPAYIVGIGYSFRHGGLF